MNIKVARPPMFDEIDAVFHIKDRPVIFAWGDTIYNPMGIEISPWLAAHEHVHQLQQKGEPAFWWGKYLVDKEFRLAQEIPAHQEEYKQYCQDFQLRNMRRVAARLIAERLSSPLYGNMISADKARRLVKSGKA